MAMQTALTSASFDTTLSELDIVTAIKDFMMATKYAFWNNKGGTGKTSIAF